MRHHDILGAALRRRDAQAAFLSVKTATHDDVHNARDSIGAIQRRGAVKQDIHPLNRRRRESRGVCELAAEAGSSQTATIDKNQRRSRAQAPEIDAGRIDGVRTPAIGTGKLNNRRG